MVQELELQQLQALEPQVPYQAWGAVVHPQASLLLAQQALVLPELQALHLVDLESDQPYGFLYQVMY